MGFTEDSQNVIYIYMVGVSVERELMPLHFVPVLSTLMGDIQEVQQEISSKKNF